MRALRFREIDPREERPSPEWWQKVKDALQRARAISGEIGLDRRAKMILVGLGVIVLILMEMQSHRRIQRRLQSLERAMASRPAASLSMASRPAASRSVTNQSVTSAAARRPVMASVVGPPLPRKTTVTPAKKNVPNAKKKLKKKK